MKEPLIDRAREAFAAYRGLRRDIIDIEELIFALTVANKEAKRLRESHAELLVVAKWGVEALEIQIRIGNPQWDMSATQESVLGRMRAAIAKAEGIES